MFSISMKLSFTLTSKLILDIITETQNELIIVYVKRNKKRKRK